MYATTIEAALAKLNCNTPWYQKSRRYQENHDYYIDPEKTWLLYWSWKIMTTILIRLVRYPCLCMGKYIVVVVEMSASAISRILI